MPGPTGAATVVLLDRGRGAGRPPARGDVDGAARAGLRTARIDRTGAPHPESTTSPSLRADRLVDLAAQLA